LLRVLFQSEGRSEMDQFNYIEFNILAVELAHIQINFEHHVISCKLLINL